MKHNRKHYDGAIYHVMLRGNNKQNLFFQMNDYNFFIERLKICIDKYGIKIHLFCLMTNHVHLVIEVERVPLTKIMQSLQTSFTLTMNKRYNRCGHLSQGRFIDKLVQNEKYLLELCYYIHHNPIKARMVKCLNDYPWSSHHAYLKFQFEWVHTKLLNSLIKKHGLNQYKSYSSFIYDRENTFATPKFFEFDEFGNIKVTDIVGKKIELSRTTELKHLELDIIIKKSCEQFNVVVNKLYSESYSSDAVMLRSIIAYIAHYFGGYHLKDIALHFGRSHGSFSLTTHNNITKIQKDHELKRKLDRIIKKLSSDIE